MMIMMMRMIMMMMMMITIMILLRLFLKLNYFARGAEDAGAGICGPLLIPVVDFVFFWDRKRC